MQKKSRLRFLSLLALATVAGSSVQPAFAANSNSLCGATEGIQITVTPVTLDSSATLGYRILDDQSITKYYNCQDDTSHLASATHTVKIADFHPTTIGLKTPTGYKWAGWYYSSRNNLTLDKVQTPPGKTYYSFSSDYITPPGQNNHVVYMIYQESSKKINLTYNANGGTGDDVTDTVTVTGSTAGSFTVKNNPFTAPSNKEFAGWSTSEDGTAEYAPGSTFTAASDHTLYAIWKDHTHSDTNSDGFCDSDNACMHDKDENGYCTEQDCTHPTSCCPKKENANPVKPSNPTDDDTTEKISEPGMDKKTSNTEDADEIGTVKPKDTINFSLNSTVPETLSKLANKDQSALNGTYNLVFHDTMTGPITLDKSSIKVNVGDSVLDTQYYTINTDVDKTFTVSVDLIAAYNGGAIDWDDLGKTAIVVDYDATVDADAENAATVKNEAWVTYPDGESKHDIPTGTVENEIPVTPPSTGGISAALMTLFGGITITGSGALVMKARRKEKDD